MAPFCLIFFRVSLVTVVFLVLLGLKVLLETLDGQESLASLEPEWVLHIHSLPAQKQSDSVAYMKPSKPKCGWFDLIQNIVEICPICWMMLTVWKICVPFIGSHWSSRRCWSSRQSWTLCEYNINTDFVSCLAYERFQCFGSEIIDGIFKDPKQK